MIDTAGSVAKHRVYAIEQTDWPDAGNQWEWVFHCGACDSPEFWETWDLACWYLELHVRVHHGARNGA
jgi:hypothetical protein